MTFDGFFVHSIVRELRAQLLNGRIMKIYQPFEQELQIVVRSNRQNQRLAASIHPVYYHINLTEERPSNPTHAPMFCMLLRKHLENALILDIRQVDNDRIIEFELSGRDELGDLQNYLLIFELMGRHSNILLVNQAKETIIDCIKHIAPSQNSYRTLQPGAQYVRPPLNEQQTNILALSNTEREHWCLEHAEVLANGQGARIVQGMSTLLAQEVAYWMTHCGMTTIEAMQHLIDQLSSPTPLLIAGDKLNFYAFNLQHLEGVRTEYAHLSALVSQFFAQKVHVDRIKQVSGDLVQKLQQILERNANKLRKLHQDRSVAQNAETYRIKGELLNAYSYQVSKGANQVVLENYYDDNKKILVELDPRKSAVENGQIYFKKYTKYRDALHFIDEQEALTQAENDYLEGILVQLHQADIEDVELIKQELAEQGYGGQRKGTIKKRAKQTTQPRRFRSSDGVMIYVGRNNQQNDELSLKKATKHHWWLHAKNIPGAHVIVESDNPSDQTMTEAAMIAAYYSKFQQSANVPVDAVQAKYLRKPNGAKPGYVIYEGQRTLFVTPEEKKIKHLEIQN
ncbi:NFACT family protein [Aerococcaceae bacterium NML190073]|nr:NFACT family protein [Aerococcaceae bacterium NML190073]MCW6664988.1 NFACT family protein [Aerococcaceae bacterium NML191219]MCW6666347.1 NFACT family protein [Aerococcaceae bacterium NML190938]